MTQKILKLNFFTLRSWTKDYGRSSEERSWAKDLKISMEEEWNERRKMGDTFFNEGKNLRDHAIKNFGTMVSG